MEERLFENHRDLDFKTIADTVNYMLKENFDLFKDKDSIEKWTSFPVVFYEKKDIKEKFIEEVKYIDELLYTKIEKLSCIVTLSGLMEIEGLKIKNMDLSNLFVLVNYFRDIDVTIMSNYLKVVDDEDYILNIRKKFLDIEKRNFFISYTIKLAKKKIKNLDDSDSIKNFLNDMIAMLNEKDSYDIMEEAGYNDYVKEREIRMLELESEEANKN
ncbi:MAG: hypothetical protein PHQ64_02805 [Bacilli bacterium]|nr:hypothetical protein [Bacilli bacterium]